MKITVMEEDTGRIIVGGSSEGHDERSVSLDSVDLLSSKPYILEYEFFAKSVVMEGEDDVLVSGGHMGAMACTEPFIVQELVI